MLGNLIAEDGHQTLGMIVLNDSYGTGLAGYVTEAFEAAGGEVVAAPTYNTGDTTFDAQIGEVLAADPDAIALITFEEVTTILRRSDVGQFPAENFYFVDGNLSNFGEELPAGSASTGAKGTLPGLSIDTLGRLHRRARRVPGGGGQRLRSRSTATRPSRSTRSSCSRSQRWPPARPRARRSPRSSRRSPVVRATARSASRSPTAPAIIIGGGVADYDGISGPDHVRRGRRPDRGVDRHLPVTARTTSTSPTRADLTRDREGAPIFGSGPPLPCVLRPGTCGSRVRRRHTARRAERMPRHPLLSVSWRRR